MSKYVRLSRRPCDVFLIRCPPDLDSPLRGQEANALLANLLIGYPQCVFRGVSVDRLSIVLRQGIDIHPTDGVIFAALPDKAIEYGAWPKILLALDRDSLSPTFKEISTNSSEEAIQSVRRDFPNLVRSIDGSKLWCTRFSKDDPRIATDYEIGYAWWIPGDPLAALKAVFVLLRPEDSATFLANHYLVKGQ
jgi:hypothetical protein